MTKCCSRSLLLYYLLCRGLTLVTLLCACLYLGYYLQLASVTDNFGCPLRVGLLANDSTIPEMVQCKLIAVGVFSLLSLVNLIVFISLIPAVIYASLRPLFCQGYAHFLETYQTLPTVSILPKPDSQWDDLSMYLLYLEENISELKSYKYMKVLEMLRKQGERSGENVDTLDLLMTLGVVKMDNVDGKKAVVKSDQVEINTADPNHGAKNNVGPSNSTSGNNTTVETEMQEFSPLLSGSSDVPGSRAGEGGALRQRTM
uniref:Pannexin 1 n=5 Tax=Iconisemion striatum TaxID=60296 RepID=A0A1A7XLS0_9TELE